MIEKGRECVPGLSLFIKFLVFEFLTCPSLPFYSKANQYPVPWLGSPVASLASFPCPGHQVLFKEGM